MRGLTLPLWPIRYKPHPDELLSSWLVRLARGHGLRVQTFCNLIFGNRLQVWNRDIDRLGPDWIVDVLSERTGTPIDVTRGTTLRSYEGWLYPAFKASGSLQWMTSLQVFHRTRQGFGMQYCPKCLLEDRDPYFRKVWRVRLLRRAPGTNACSVIAVWNAVQGWHFTVVIWEVRRVNIGSRYLIVMPAAKVWPPAWLIRLSAMTMRRSTGYPGSRTPSVSEHKGRECRTPSM